MSSIPIALIAFICVFGGAVIGMIVHTRLPTRYLDGESKDVVKLVMGLIGTMSALVLGLLIASAQGNYQTQRAHVAQLSADVLELNRILSLYGPESKETRELLRQSVIDAIEQIWNRKPPVGEGPTDAFFTSVQNLSPQTDAQRLAKAEALQVITDTARTRVLMYAQLAASISLPVLGVLVSWLFLIFVGFGVLTRFNGTVVAALLVGALSVAGAIFLVLDLDAPYQGLMRISSAPLQSALAQMNQ